MDIIKVLIAGVQKEEKEEIVEALSNVEYISATDGADTTEQVLEILEQKHVDVVLVDAYISGKGYKLAETIADLFPGIAVVIIERELKEDTMRAALFAGAKDVLIYPFTPAKLVDSIYRSYQTERKRQSSRQSRVGRGKTSGRGQIITVFGTKGGTGKTFVSTNLAVTLASANNKVALVDLDLDFGNAALALNIIPRFTVADVVNEIGNIDHDLLESYLIPHRSGVKLLAANAEPQMTEFVHAEHVGLILKILQDIYDYVIVDMPARFYDPVDPALQAADMLLLVATPEVVTLRNIKSCLNTLSALNYPSAKIRVVLNKVDTGSDIKLRDVETTLNSKVFASLQAEYRQVCASMNQGIPMVELFPRSKISRSFNDLASSISGNNNQKKTKERQVVINEETDISEVSR